MPSIYLGAKVTDPIVVEAEAGEPVLYGLSH